MESMVHLRIFVLTGTQHSAHIPLAKACHTAEQGREANCAHRKTTDHVAMGGHVSPFIGKEGANTPLGNNDGITTQCILMYIVCKIFNSSCP